MHKPVLLNEVIQCLDPKPGENFIDCTIGEAGHSLAILQRIEPDGKVLGIDADLSSLKRIESQDRLFLVHGNFKNLKEIAQKNNFGQVNGILFDLGLSLWQIEKSGRGFSFQQDEPLDMTFDRGKLNAAQIINSWSEESLKDIFEKYGEEKYSGRIASEIVKARKKASINTTYELRAIIERTVPRSRVRRGQINRVLARIFQSLRIAVNDELENLKQGLEQALKILEPGGKLAVISFHSLEDRIVKNFFRSTADQPQAGKIKILTKKPITANEEEIRTNPRSRSAKLRVAIKF